MIRVLTFVLSIATTIASSGKARATETVLNVVTYQPPAGFIEALNERAPDNVSFNTSGWVAVADADFVVYFMSSFDNWYEMPEFALSVFEAMGEGSENSFVRTQAIDVPDRRAYVVFVAAGELSESHEEINCHVVNTILLLIQY